jgi:hypothetical protein
MVASSTGNYKWWVCTYLLASLIIALGLPIFGNNNLQGNAALIWHRSDRTATYYSAADTAYYPYMEAYMYIYNICKCNVQKKKCVTMYDLKLTL